MRRKAVAALEVRGAGPETAFRILGKMHQKEDKFYMDLLKTKIRYLRTREYWENRKIVSRLNSRRIKVLIAKCPLDRFFNC